jgi:hypothetical protein
MINMKHWWKDGCQGKTEILREEKKNKNINPTWNSLDLNLNRCCEKSASDHLSHGRAIGGVNNRWIQLKLICSEFTKFTWQQVH